MPRDFLVRAKRNDVQEAEQRGEHAAEPAGHERAQQHRQQEDERDGGRFNEGNSQQGQRGRAEFLRFLYDVFMRSLWAAG